MKIEYTDLEIINMWIVNEAMRMNEMHKGEYTGREKTRLGYISEEFKQ